MKYTAMRDLLDNLIIDLEKKALERWNNGDPGGYLDASAPDVVYFDPFTGVTTVTETFEPGSENPVEMQRAGWQAILDNYRKHTESL